MWWETCAQSVVHKALWIAVDMWRTALSGGHVGAVDASYIEVRSQGRVIGEIRSVEMTL